MLHNRIATLGALLISLTLVLAGGGCIKAVDETNQAVVDGAVSVPLGAYDRAVKLSDGEKARQHREDEAASNYVTVAMVVTEGAEVPEGVTLGPTIGCNDQIAFIKVSRVSDSGQVLIDALNTLLGVRDISYKGLHNALANSTLQVKDKTYGIGSAGIEIHLEGEPRSSGTCDDPRIKSQIEETIRYFEPQFSIFLNGKESTWNCIGNMSGLCE